MKQLNEAIAGLNRSVSGLKVGVIVLGVLALGLFAAAVAALIVAWRLE